MAKAAKPPLRSGRQARLIERAAPPAINPCPPGQRGGQYRPLSDGDMAAIYSASLRLLAELGMGEVPDRLAALMLANGAKQADGRVLLPDQLVKSAIRAAPKRFDFHGRDASRTIEVGGDAVHFGTAGAAVQTLDLETGSYRPSTLADLHDFARLQDALTNISWFTRCCIATDVTDPFELDVNTGLCADQKHHPAGRHGLYACRACRADRADAGYCRGGAWRICRTPVSQSPYQPGHIADALWRRRG